LDSASDLYRKNLTLRIFHKSKIMPINFFKKPAFWLLVQLQLLKKYGLKIRIKAFMRKFLLKINHELLVRTTLRRKIVDVCRRIGIYTLLKRFLLDAQYLSTEIPSKQEKKYFENLSPRGFQIYKDLKNTIEKNTKVGH
jgi:hypothetical protein